MTRERSLYRGRSTNKKINYKQHDCHVNEPPRVSRERQSGETLPGVFGTKAQQSADDSAVSCLCFSLGHCYEETTVSKVPLAGAGLKAGLTPGSALCLAVQTPSVCVACSGGSEIFFERQQGDLTREQSLTLLGSQGILDTALCQEHWLWLWGTTLLPWHGRCRVLTLSSPLLIQKHHVTQNNMTITAKSGALPQQTLRNTSPNCYLATLLSELENTLHFC